MPKNILITGASGNLGRATVEKFLAEGHRVTAIVSPGRNLEIEGHGKIDVVEADVTSEPSVNRAIQFIVEKNKTIDAAVLLVGAFAPGTLAETDASALKKMFSINFESAYFFARPVFMQMQQQGGGRLVLIGARPALQAKTGKGVLAYALSKSLLFKLAEFLNAEGASKNIVTSVVVPSTIDTVANRRAMPDADFTSWVAPEEIAEVISMAVTNTSLREPVYKVYGNA